MATPQKGEAGWVDIRASLRAAIGALGGADGIPPTRQDYVNRALDFVRAQFPGDVIEARNLSSAISSFDMARTSAACCEQCGGVENCPVFGAPCKVFREDAGGNAVYVVRAEPCAAKHEQVSRRQVEANVKASRIPQELAKCTFAGYKPPTPSARAALRLAEIAAREGDGLLLQGPPGVGKTHLAVSVVKAALAEGRSAVFLPVVSLLDELKEAVLNSRAEPLLSSLRGADCLALDDLGMHKTTEWVTERLYGLINDRYNDGRQIIITTNAESWGDLASMIGAGGEQIVSRLREMTTPIRIEAADFRPAKRAARAAAAQGAAA